MNVTEDGQKTLGYRKDPVIVTVRISPQKRSEAIESIKTFPAIEIFRVAGDVDAVLIVEQDELDHILEMLAGVDGVLETKSLLSIASYQKHSFNKSPSGSVDGAFGGLLGQDARQVLRTPNISAQSLREEEARASRLAHARARRTAHDAHFSNRPRVSVDAQTEVSRNE